MPTLHSLALLLQSGDGGSTGALLGALACMVLIIVATWKVYTKAGHPGWVLFIPIYNAYVLLKIVGRPGWWLLLLLVPLVNFIIAIVVNFDLARSFGKGVGFGLGLTFLSPIFYIILGLGAAEYEGPAAAAA
jgi:hypothetical protein